MISDDRIEILCDTNALAVGGVRRLGKARGGQEFSRALGAVIVFADARGPLTVFILHDRWPVRTNYSPHQLGIILSEHGHLS